MNIYSVIVTYNAMRRNWISKCLGSLQQSTVPIVAVVVDNASSDGTGECIAADFPDAVWLPQEENLGFGRANNVGIKYALEHGADYILLLNQDATVKEDAVEIMCKVSDGQSVVSPVQLNGDASRLDTLFKYVLLQAENFLIDDLLIKESANESYDNGKYAAACWLLPVNVIKKVGGFNPLFFQYSEDYNYLCRVRYHHFKTMLATRAFMCHDRNVHGSNSIFSKSELHREMLLAACDINNSLKAFIIQWAKLFLHSYTRKLPRLRYVPGQFLVELLWFLSHANGILGSRKKEKQTGTTWL